MKKIIGIVSFILISISIQAQELYWETNMHKAVAISKTTNKPLLIFFTGSDWCVWCVRLQKEVLKTAEFGAWAKENVVLVELDYPRNKVQTKDIREQNSQLQQLFGVQGYPTLLLTGITEKEGKINFNILGKTGYVAGGPSAWLATVDDILKKK